VLPSSPSPAAQTRSAPLLRRGLATVLVLTALFGGPVVRQGLLIDHIAGVPTRLLPRWTMFGSVGFGLTQVRFWQVDAAGEKTPVDRFAVLDVNPLDQPPGVWRLHGEADLKRLGRHLCRALGPGTDLRVRARTATRRGWKREAKEAGNLCEPKAP
jgi:hypothetical protein